MVHSNVLFKYPSIYYPIFPFNITVPSINNFRHITAYPNLRMSSNFLIENDFVHKNTDMWTRTTIKIIKFSMEEKNTNENM